LQRHTWLLWFLGVLLVAGVVFLSREALTPEPLCPAAADFSFSSPEEPALLSVLRPGGVRPLVPQPRRADGGGPEHALIGSGLPVALVSPPRPEARPVPAWYCSLRLRHTLPPRAGPLAA